MRTVEWGKGSFRKAGRTLENLLDRFSSKYGRGLEVKPGPIDLTAYFINDQGQWRKPKSFGDFEVVYCYIVLGAPFVEKYVLEEEETGGLRLQYKERSDNAGAAVPKTVAPGLDFKVMSFLSTFNMHNTSLCEVIQPFVKSYDMFSGEFELRKDEEIQGFRRWNLVRITERARRNYPEFHPLKDSMFMFAGTEPVIRSKIELNALWFQQFLEVGKDATFQMSDREADLLERVVGWDYLLWVLDDFRIGHSPLRIAKLNYWSTIYPEQTNDASIAFTAYKLKAYAVHRGLYAAVDVFWGGGLRPIKPEEIGTVTRMSRDIFKKPSVQPRVAHEPRLPY